MGERWALSSCSFGGRIGTLPLEFVLRDGLRRFGYS